MSKKKKKHGNLISDMQCIRYNDECKVCISSEKTGALWKECQIASALNNKTGNVIRVSILLVLAYSNYLGRNSHVIEG